MTMAGPIADMLTRLCSANRAHRNAVSMPYSKLENAIANTLVEEGYLASASVENAHVGKTLTLILKYDSHRESAIKGLQRISKPGLHVYAKPTSLPKVHGGLGVVVLSTSSGLLTDRQAADKGVGGKILTYIW